MDKTDTILNLFPNAMRKAFTLVAQKYDDLTEIHIRCDQPVLILRRNKEYVLLKDGRESEHSKQKQNALIYDAPMIEQLFSHLCHYSPYAYQEELKAGFLTVMGGHRVGIAGQVFYDCQKVKEMRMIRYLNIRISHEIIGIADPCIPYVYDEMQDKIRSCLIIAPPGKGKTTLLRDLIRQISNGSATRRGRIIGVVDERSEIGGSYRGRLQNDLGMRTDVLDQCPKAFGMLMLLRSMSPEIIAVDEIATKEDVKSLLFLERCGVKVFATVHGTNLAQVKQKRYLRPLFENAYFQCYLTMHEAGIEKMIVKEEEQ